jgi:thiosulfate dehydrogenase
MRQMLGLARNTSFLSAAAMMALGLFFVDAAVFAPMPAVAQEVTPETPTNIWAISRGGQLYDEWWAVIEAAEPKGTHPAYPAAGKKKGSTTWRCKECHGWDYKGVDGAYSSGSHRTGIKGLRGMAGVDPETIHNIIRNETHAYTEEMMPDSAIRKLALFISLGQIDMDRYIDRATKQAHGDPQRGAQFFQTICANCHGFDGKRMNFGDEDGPEYVGTVAGDNPWEALHKIRFGQPGVGMVSLSVLDIQQQVDILSYAQTLPKK